MDNFIRNYLDNTNPKKDEVSCTIDTGCTNTLVPLIFAKEYGKRLNKTSTAVVGGRSYEVTVYSLDNV